MNRTILGTLPFICAAALADTQDFSFEEIYRRTVEAINWDMAVHAMDDSVVATRRTNV
jgi:hypothetical protein